MLNSPPSSGYEFLDFDPPRQRGHGLYLGDAYFKTPSAGCCRLSVYRDHGQVVFGALHDPEPLSPGNLKHEVQIALPEALREVCPESFVEDAEVVP